MADLFGSDFQVPMAGLSLDYAIGGDMDGIIDGARSLYAGAKDMITALVADPETAAAPRAAPVATTPAGCRDWIGNGGYRYRQCADASITILQAPAGREGSIGMVLRSSDTGTRQQAWFAITNEIAGKATAEARAREASGGSSTTRADGDDVAEGDLWDRIKAIGAGTQSEQQTALIATAGRAAGMDASTVAALAPVATSAVAGLLTAAGVSSAVPVAGWVVGGGLAVAAGAIALVKWVRKGKVSEKKVVAIAKKLGYPDAAKVPKFTVRVLKMGDDQRERLGHRLAARAQSSKLTAKRRQLVSSRLRILAAADLIEKAARRQGAIKGIDGLGG